MGLDGTSNLNPLETLTNLGLRVFPIPLNEKRPRQREFWRIASDDPYFSLDRNNGGISTGDGIVVFDFDFKPDADPPIDARPTLAAWEAAGLIPPTLKVRSQSGGYHLFFRTERPAAEGDPDYGNRAGILPGVDVRGYHGYVVCAGSSIDGRYYEIVENPGVIAPLPDALRKYLTKSPPRSEEADTPLAELDQPAMLARAARYLTTEAPTAIEGGRNATLYRTACVLRDIGVTEQTALDLLAEHWLPEKCFPPLEDKEVTTTVASAWRTAKNPPAATAPEAEFTEAIPNAEAMMARPNGAALADLGEPPPPSPSQAPADGEMEIPLKPWAHMDFATIPRRDVLYSNHYIRKFVSATIAPGGIGKSALALAEALAMATGRPLLGIEPKTRLRVAYYNAEDPLDEIQRRVAGICGRYDIPQKELEGWFFTASGRESDLLLATGERGDINVPAFRGLRTFAIRNRIDVLIVDPLANMTTSDETNEVFRKLGKWLSKLADATNMAIEVVHHTRKLNGTEATVEDGRGGSALVNAVRAARVLSGMTADEAARAYLENQWDHFCIRPGGKNNVARVADKAAWFRREVVRIGNGDTVAVVVPWSWPDAMDGVSADVVRRVYRLIGEGEGEGRPYRSDIRAARWAGLAVAEVLALDAGEPGDRERAKLVLRTLVESGILVNTTLLDRKQGREIGVVICGDLGNEDEA